MMYVILEKAKAYSRIRRGKLEQVKATQEVASRVVHSEIMKLIDKYTELIQQKRKGRNIKNEISNLMKRLNRLRSGKQLQPTRYGGSARHGFYKLGW